MKNYLTFHSYDHNLIRLPVVFNKANNTAAINGDGILDSNALEARTFTLSSKTSVLALYGKLNQ